MAKARLWSLFRCRRPVAAWLVTGLFCTAVVLYWGCVQPGSCGGLSVSTVVGFALAITIDPEI